MALTTKRNSLTYEGIFSLLLLLPKKMFDFDGFDLKMFDFDGF